MIERPSQLLYPAVAMTLAAFVLVVYEGGPAVMGSNLSLGAAGLALAGLISIWRPVWQPLLTGVASHAAAALLFLQLPEVSGRAELGYWVLLIAVGLTAWAFGQSLWAMPRVRAVAVPLLAVLWVLIVWEIVARGLAAQDVLPPAPSELLWGPSSSQAQS